MKKNVLLALIAAAMVVLAGLMIAAGFSFRAESGEDDLPALSGEVVEITAVPVTRPPASPTDLPPSPMQEPVTAPTDTPSPTHTPQPAQSAANLPAVTPISPTSILTPSPTPANALGEAHAIVAEPTYLADGRWAEVMVTVRNVSVASGIATGYTYLRENPDGGIQYVTGFGAEHYEVPQAIIVDGAPLWRGHVQWDDGQQWWFPAGCFYVETVDANGWEPIGGGDGFHWEVHWTGGFFDCGNSTRKLPQYSLIMPGQEATVPLYVYLQHPRLWTDPNWGPPHRAITYIGIEVFDGSGRSLGIIGELDWR